MRKPTRQPSADPLDARIDRIRAIWALMATTAPESRETFLAKLDEIGRAWTGYCWQPEYVTPNLPPGHPIPWADLVPYERDQGGYWLYGTDPFGADKRFVRVQPPAPRLGRPVRANDVEVATIRQARCRIPGCGWKGDEHDAYLYANGERQAHLDWHRNGAPDPRSTQQ